MNESFEQPETSTSDANKSSIESIGENEVLDTLGIPIDTLKSMGMPNENPEGKSEDIEAAIEESGISAWIAERPRLRKALQVTVLTSVLAGPAGGFVGADEAQAGGRGQYSAMEIEQMKRHQEDRARMNAQVKSEVARWHAEQQMNMAFDKAYNKVIGENPGLNRVDHHVRGAVRNIIGSLFK